MSKKRSRNDADAGMKALVEKLYPSLDPTGIFLPDPKNDNLYIKLPWSTLDSHTFGRIKKELTGRVDAEQDQIFFIGRGKMALSDGTVGDFNGIKIRSPEHAYQLGIDPETGTGMPGPGESVGRVYSSGPKER